MKQLFSLFLAVWFAPQIIAADLSQVEVLKEAARAHDHALTIENLTARRQTVNFPHVQLMAKGNHQLSIFHAIRRNHR